MSKKIISCIHEFTQKLTPAYDNTHQAEQYAWYLLEKATDLSKIQLLTKKEYFLSGKEEALLAQWIKEIIEDHKPIHYILGTVPFLDLTITVEPPILIPRPETEEWCNRFIERLQKNTPAHASLKILDLCTGSGCIGLAIAQAFPHSTVYASDISPQALALAQKNARNNNISNIIFIESDLYTTLPNIRFDYIISNPPYITQEEYLSLDPSVSRWEDKCALMAHDQGLETIRKIIANAPRFLQYSQQENPSIWVEIGFKQSAAVQEIFHHAGFKTEILQDLFDNDRVVIGYVKGDKVHDKKSNVFCLPRRDF